PDELLNLIVGLVREDRVLGRARQESELARGARIEMGEPLAVDLLEAADRARELALLDPARALDPDAPPELGVPVERHEVREVVACPAGTAGERPARVDHRRRHVERAE